MTNAFAYPAGDVAGCKGGKFALVGPGWKGTLPDGVTRIDCPTRWIELQPRAHVKNEGDLAGAQKVLHGIKLQGLAEHSGGASTGSIRCYSEAISRTRIRPALPGVDWKAKGPGRKQT